ncbi:MAG: [protein-PII] uridylyltransferase [Deltaproteobacteria bacterium]|nr:[protein-PII] uridylyltransferase [Deltaproteobacteria bacterium]
MAFTGSSSSPSEWIAARVKQARNAAEENQRAGKDGVALSTELTAALDEVVITVANQHLRHSGITSGVAVMATGGYGRGEWAPYSDLDLVFLCAESPDANVATFASAVLHDLWDARLDAGHATRSIADTHELAESDLTVATAMLDARFLTGDQGLAKDFIAGFVARAGAQGQGNLVERLRQEQTSRHSKFGDTIFLLEPDLKSGPGGIRDLCIGRWAAHARFGTADFRQLHDLGELTLRQCQALQSAREWFLNVRIAVQLAARRKQDQLRFDIQERVAPIWFKGPKTPSGAPAVKPGVSAAVEGLMRQYQLHARAVSRETERLMQRAALDPNHEPTIIPVSLRSMKGRVDPNFVIRDGRIEVMDPKAFVERPSEMIRVFSVGIELGLDVGLRTTDLISELCAERPLAVQTDPNSGAAFLEILTDTRDKKNPSRLEQMQDLGLLTALMPEWAPVTGRVQHDTYHVYTVDRHSLYAVALLKTLARREMIDEYPRATQEMAFIERHIPLYVATLLHDIAKPVGNNHSLRGVPIASAIARRLGLSDDDVALVELLVREHLTLGHVSQRRDLSDPSTIEKTAELAGDEETLRQLFLLTFVDLYCVGPGNLTSWKDELLRELFERSFSFMRHGAGVWSEQMQERVRDRKSKAKSKLSEHMPEQEVDSLFAGLPERYFIENSVFRITQQPRLLRARKGACAVDFVHHPRRQYSEMVLVADDVPGLLATVTGVLFANRIDILDAAIYSREAVNEGEVAEALDVFRIRRAFHGAVTDDARLESIRRDLLATLEGRRSVKELVASRPATSSILEGPRPKVPPTEVKVHNNITPNHTVIDVFTEDRPGVLYTIADILYTQRLDIQRSKVGVEADRVADIFYVRDSATRGQLTDPVRIAQLIDTLKAALHRP